MIDKDVIREIIAESAERARREYIEREGLPKAEKYLRYKEILAITGVRRSGKTYLMYQLMNRLVTSGVPEKNIVYINFEDERLAFLEAEDLAKIYEIFLESRNPEGKTYFFLDEIQNVPLWDKWLSRMYEKDIKFVVSGSNASLLSSEFSTALTGRNVVFGIYPFSFREFLMAKIKKQIEPGEARYKAEERAKIKGLLSEFMNHGGFPEVTLRNAFDLLNQYFNDILFRDIVKRYAIKHMEAIEKLAFYLLTNISSLSSFYSLKKMFDIKSVNTIKNYVSYFEKAYLIFRVPLFSYSIKQQIYNPFKVYSVDTGLRNAVSFKFSRDYGKLAENAVFLELKRKGKDVYYWKSQKSEVDFVIKQGPKPSEFIQVCWNTDDEDTKKRGVKSLIECLKNFKCDEGLIITEDYSGEEKIEGKILKYIPLWLWLLEN